MGEREREDQTLLGQHGSGSQDVHRAAPLRTLLLGQLHADADDDNGGDDRQRGQTRIPGLALSCCSWIERACIDNREMP